LRRAFPLSRPKRRQAGAESLCHGKRGMHLASTRSVNHFRVIQTERVETQCPPRFEEPNAEISSEKSSCSEAYLVI